MTLSYSIGACWYDPEDGYRKHTLVLVPEGQNHVSLNDVELIDGDRAGMVSLKEAQRWLLYLKAMYDAGEASVRLTK